MTTAPAPVAAPKTQSLFKPWPKQRAAMEMVLVDTAQQMLFGGAAGGGKSGWARMVASVMAVAWPGSKVAIFRRSDKELQANHVTPWLREVDTFVPGGRWFAQKMEYHWPSPPWCWCPKAAPCAHSSVTSFDHVDDNRGVLKYQGDEFAAEIVDEATHFKGSDIEYLYTRIRAPEEMELPRDVIGPDGRTYHYPGWPNYRPVQALTANPGGVGHGYMRDTYIDPVEGLVQLKARQEEGVLLPLEVSNLAPILHPTLGIDVWEEPVMLRGEKKWITVDMRGGQTWTVDVDLGPELGVAHVNRAFIPARLQDNPSLNPQVYAAGLAAGSAENRERLLKGDWSYSEDRVFKVIAKDIHLVEHSRVFLPRDDGSRGYPPDDWLRGIGLDHGSAKPTAVEWLAYDSDNEVYVFYAEYYRPGSVAAHVKAVRAIMEEDGHPELRPQADPQMWRLNQSSKDEVVSVAALWQYGGEIPDDPIGREQALRSGITLSQSKITTEAGLLAFEEMVAIDPERPFPSWHPRAGEYGAPLLYFTTECPHLFRELTALVRPEQGKDGYYGEGLKNGQPDHAYDAAYRIADPLRKATQARKMGRGRTGPRTTFSYGSR